MKPKNFPAAKLTRKINAEIRVTRGRRSPMTEIEIAQIEAARTVRTKKIRSR